MQPLFLFAINPYSPIIPMNYDAQQLSQLVNDYLAKAEYSRQPKGLYDPSNMYWPSAANASAPY